LTAARLLAILTLDMTDWKKYARINRNIGGISRRFVLILVILLGCSVGVACRPAGDPEAAGRVNPTDVTAELVEVGAGEPLIKAAASQAEIVPALPTPVPPASPTPPPTVAVVAIDNSSNPSPLPAEALIATQTAAASPPTPAITGEPIPAPLTETTPEPMPTPSGIYSWTLKVPILMYHYISTPPEDADVYRTDLSVTPEQFREQMIYLQDNGYTTIDFYDLSQAIVSHKDLPEKPIILTFDDGYLDNYENAYPILQEFGYEGTFFVVTEFIDTQRAEYMTWPMIEEMARNDMRIESHSRTHPDLRGMAHERLIWEILGSQETLAAHIGYKPRYFCYPGGWYDEATIQTLGELDFWGATTTANGSWHGFDDRYEWRRVRIRNTTTLAEFSRLVDLEGTVSGKTVQ
jgi:peptidoglycan/xylan/chitin deacetylase (PgdA/CDA1 family)